MLKALDPPTAACLGRDAFLDGLERTGLLDPKQVAGARRSPGSAAVLADRFVEAGLLTRFQSDRILRGQTSGFVIGPYVVLDYLAQSDAGRVYKARHRVMRRDVAMVVLRADLTAGEGVRARLREKARAAARLAHPNVITLLDVNAVGGRVYYVEEYVDGGDLTTLLKQSGRLGVGRACEFFRQAAAGVQHAHERGLCHGRLRPAAVRIGNAGGAARYATPQVKVAGFGLGRLTQGRDRPCFEYLAPEQFAAPHLADVPSDLYALGCVFHAMLTGVPPFPGLTPHDAATHHAKTPPPDLRLIRPDVPRPVADLVESLLAKDPRDRPASAEDAAAAVAPYAADDAGSAVDFGLPVGPGYGSASMGHTLARLQALSEAGEASPWASLTSPNLDLGHAADGAETLDGPAAFPTAPARKRCAARREAPRRTSWLIGAMLLLGLLAGVLLKVTLAAGRAG